MGHRSLTVAALAAGLVVTACDGDPIVVLGDTPGLMRVVLGVGDSVGTRVDSLATRSRLNEPGAVVFDPVSNTLYAADRGATRVSGGITTRVARIFAVNSRGRARLILDAGGCNPGCIIDPAAMTLANGALIVADPAGNRVLSVSPAGAVTVLAGTGTLGSSPDGTPAKEASLDAPAGVAVGADGLVYFSESTGNRIRRITAAGLLETVAGNGSATHSGDGGLATAAGISRPAGLLWADGVLYVAESGAGSVRAIRNDTITTVAGIGASGFTGDDGPAVEARLDAPVSLASGNAGRTLYVADRNNHRVRAIDLQTGVIRTFAGTGSRVWTGGRQAAGQTAVAQPVAVHAAGGFLFITARQHSVVWRTATDYN